MRYSWYNLYTHFDYMPDRLAIHCPQCRREATLWSPFSDRYIEEITRRRENNEALKPFAPMSVEELQRRVTLGLTCGVLERDGDEYVVVRFPHMFPLDWEPPSEASKTGWGACICTFCGYFRKHLIHWPDDAHFAVTLRAGIPISQSASRKIRHRVLHGNGTVENILSNYNANYLWAYTREHARALLGYIESESRDAAAYPPYEYLLKRTPSVFLRAKNRKIIVPRLRALLEGE